jgi:hypothetical protein
MDDKNETPPPAPKIRRRIVDLARANAFRVGDAGIDLDAAIDAAITEAMIEREQRSRPKQTKE